MPQTKVYLLDGGRLSGTDMFWNAEPKGRIQFPIYSVLIDHAEGRFLFDSGYDKNHMLSLLPPGEEGDDARRLMVQSERQTIPGQLDLIGLKPSDVSHVMNSHYHVDHVGGNRHCTCATTICHRAELEAATYPASYEVRGYSDRSYSPREVAVAALDGVELPVDELSGQADDIYTPKFELISGDQEVAKGVWLLETPGHTPGHYSCMVELANRPPMLFAGDACYTKHAADNNLIAAYHNHVEDSYASLERLKVLAVEHDAEIFYSHDPAQWPEYTPAPGYYR